MFGRGRKRNDGEGVRERENGWQGEKVWERDFQLLVHSRLPTVAGPNENRSEDHPLSDKLNYLNCLLTSPAACQGLY